MKLLSLVTAKDRKNTAGCRKLAVFFLSCLFVFSSCSAKASVNSRPLEIPFVSGGKLYSFPVAAENQFSVKNYKLFNDNEAFTQRAVSSSKKAGALLAWDKNSQCLYHIEGNTTDKARILAKVLLPGYIAYVNQNYVLTQTNSFDDNKGFGFVLYKIKYSHGLQELKLKPVWKGNVDCFVADCFFTEEGICISGGNREDTKNNVFYITKKGIHKCFTTAKNSDFLRLLNTGDSVYAFLSGRDKTSAEPVLFRFALENKDSSENMIISLKNEALLPEAFECFFGYGFVMEPGELLVLPASINGSINFICYDYKARCIKRLVPDVTGCIAALGNASGEGTGAADGGFYYMARDPLIENSYYGISFFDGNASRKVWEIK